MEQPKIEAIETEVNDENIDENTTEVAAEENLQYWQTTCQTLYNELKIIVDMHNEKLNLLKAEKNTNIRAEIAKLNSESGAQPEKHNQNSTFSFLGQTALEVHLDKSPQT